MLLTHWADNYAVYHRTNLSYVLPPTIDRQWVRIAPHRALLRISYLYCVQGSPVQAIVLSHLLYVLPAYVLNIHVESTNRKDSFLKSVVTTIYSLNSHYVQP